MIKEGIIAGIIVGGSFLANLTLLGRPTSSIELFKGSNFLNSSIYWKMAILCGIIGTAAIFFLKDSINNETRKFKKKNKLKFKNKIF
jgi:gas vesicle protein